MQPPPAQRCPPAVLCMLLNLMLASHAAAAANTCTGPAHHRTGTCAPESSWPGCSSSPLYPWPAGGSGPCKDGAGKCGVMLQASPFTINECSGRDGPGMAQCLAIGTPTAGLDDAPAEATRMLGKQPVDPDATADSVPPRSPCPSSFPSRPQPQHREDFAEDGAFAPPRLSRPLLNDQPVAAAYAPAEEEPEQPVGTYEPPRRHGETSSTPDGKTPNGLFLAGSLKSS
jgi:hypothetical protein